MVVIGKGTTGGTGGTGGGATDRMVGVDGELPLKLLLPAKEAVTVWLPVAAKANGILAWPLASRGTVACGVPSTVNVTKPVGIAVLGLTALAVAVMVVGWPGVDGLGETLTVVVVPARFTVCVSAA